MTWSELGIASVKLMVNGGTVIYVGVEDRRKAFMQACVNALVTCQPPMYVLLRNDAILCESRRGIFTARPDSFEFLAGWSRPKLTGYIDPNGIGPDGVIALEAVLHTHAERVLFVSPD